eukprot:Skav236228  [mRNA]  locus=scaffold132:337087:343930:+ [translate_table: standard]
MAPAEIATIAENQHGTAFEVKIATAKPNATKTAVRLRLESYTRGANGKATKGTAAKQAEIRADKAKQQNKQKKEVVQKLRLNLANSTDAKRMDLVQQLEKAQELREGALSNRKQRAAQHYEKVMQRKDDTQQQILMTTAEAKQRLAGALAQKETLRGQTLAEITNRAVKHNEKVAQKVQEQRQKSKEMPADERLMNLSLRLYERQLLASP